MTPAKGSRNSHEDDRRAFLQACGKLALTVPPAMTVLLSTSMSSPALARSTGGGKGGGAQGPSGPGGTNAGTGTEAGTGDKGGTGGDIAVKEDRVKPAVGPDRQQNLDRSLSDATPRDRPRDPVRRTGN